MKLYQIIAAAVALVCLVILIRSDRQFRREQRDHLDRVRKFKEDRAKGPDLSLRLKHEKKE